MQVRAAVSRAKGTPFSIEDIQLAEPDDDQILVKIVAVGICHTDLIVRDQYYPIPQPIVLGHEGSGVVVKTGRNVTKVAPGDHVVLTIYTCGRCHPCVSGDPTSCDAIFGGNFGGRTLGGLCTLHGRNNEEIGCNFFGQSSFATYALSYERNTVKVPKEAPLELLGPLGCGLQTGAGSVLNALRPPAGSTIAIFGAGAVGLSAVMGAVLAGCGRIVSVDIKQNRLKLARELGATDTIDASSADPVAAIQNLTGGKGAPYVLETSGVPPVLVQAIRSSGVGGEIGIVGAPPMGTEIGVDVNFLLFNRTLRGIIEGNAVSDVFIPRLVDLYLQGRYPIDKLIKVYDFDDINRAVEDSEKGITLKPVLRMKT